MAYFPMFIQIEQKPCLVVGGGLVAKRKVRVLQDFGAVVTVVAPEVDPCIRQMEPITIYEKDFEDADLSGQCLVVAATDQPEINHRIYAKCKEAGILINVVDDPAYCDFIFPAYRKEKDMVAAFSSSGKSPVVAQYLKEENQKILTPLLGDINERMGELRDLLKKRYPDESERKQVIRNMLYQSLEKGEFKWNEEED